MKAFLGLGSNLGDRSQNLSEAIAMINGSRFIDVVKQSSIYETEPIGYQDQADFFNMVIEVETKLSVEELLRVVKEIEKVIGRKPTFKDGPREIDIDILLYGSVVMQSGNLVLPHPQLTERAFVLKPLIEIAPGLELPDGRKLKDIEIPKEKVTLLHKSKSSL